MAAAAWLVPKLIKIVSKNNLKTTSDFIWHAKKKKTTKKNLISKTDASNNVG